MSKIDPEELEALLEDEREDSLSQMKAFLIRMRQYIVRHRLPIGECVAWNHLKEMYGLGKDWEAEDQWLREYEARYGASIDSMPVRLVNMEE